MRIESEDHKRARLCADECSRLRDELARSKADAAHVRGRLDESRARVSELEAEARCLHIEVNSLADALGWNMQISRHETAIAVMRSAIATVPAASKDATS